MGWFDSCHERHPIQQLSAGGEHLENELWNRTHRLDFLAKSFQKTAEYGRCDENERHAEEEAHESVAPDAFSTTAAA